MEKKKTGNKICLAEVSRSHVAHSLMHTQVWTDFHRSSDMNLELKAIHKEVFKVHVKFKTV